MAAAVIVAPSPAQTVRIGTFHKASIVVAYYRSPQWAEILNGKIAEQKQAKAAGDTKRADELEKWGQAHQETAHQQLAGSASIDNIIEALKPAFPEVARKALVSAIVLDLPYVDPGVKMVDVTDLLMDWLKADARTRAIVDEVRKR
jgi:hypothetical protein